jgi:undecaprenyl-diphosphatase
LDAAIVGLAQAAALLPAISRSGTTMAAGCFRGLSRADSARFSFLIAMPATLGAGVFEIAQIMSGADTLTVPLSHIVVGVLVAAVVAFLSIHWLLNVLRRFSFTGFAIYCFILGSAILAWSALSPTV